MPLLVGMERILRQVLSLDEADGQDLLHQLLRIPRVLACVLENVACKMQRMFEERKVSIEDNDGQGGEPVVSARAP